MPDSGFTFHLVSDPTMMLRTATSKIILAALVFASPILAHAEAAQDATVKQFIEVAHLDNMQSGLAQQAARLSLPLLQEYFVKNKINLKPEQQKKLQAHLKDYAEQQQQLANNYFNSAASKSLLDASLAKAYSAQFSNEELKQIIVFYQSAAGKKLMEQQAGLLNGVGSAMLKAAETGLLPQMRAAAASYAKSNTK